MEQRRLANHPAPTPSGDGFRQARGQGRPKCHGQAARGLRRSQDVRSKLISTLVLSQVARRTSKNGITFETSQPVAAKLSLMEKVSLCSQPHQCYICSMERTDALRALNELATEQASLVTAAQASQAGVDHLTQHRLVAAGLLERMGRGVYQVSGAQPPDHPWIRVAWLRLDPRTPAWKRTGLGAKDGVVSHRSAALLHRLGDIPAHDVELSVPQRRTTREPGVRLLTRPDLTEKDITFVSGLPVTTPERTILDLLQDHADGGHIGRVIADADRQGLVDVDALGPKADGFAARYGMPEASGRELLSELAGLVDRQLATDQILEAAGTAARLGYLAGVEGVVAQMADSGVLADITTSATALPAVWQSVQAPRFRAIAERIFQTGAFDDVAKVLPALHAAQQAAQTAEFRSLAEELAKGVARAEAIQAATLPTEILRALHSSVNTRVAASSPAAKDANSNSSTAAHHNLEMASEVPHLFEASAEAALPPSVIRNIVKIAARGESRRYRHEALSAARGWDDDERVMAAYLQGLHDGAGMATDLDNGGGEADRQLTTATPTSAPREARP